MLVRGLVVVYPPRLWREIILAKSWGGFLAPRSRDAAKASGDDFEVKELVGVDDDKTDNVGDLWGFNLVGEPKLWAQGLRS